MGPNGVTNWLLFNLSQHCLPVDVANQAPSSSISSISGDFPISSQLPAPSAESNVSTDCYAIAPDNETFSSDMLQMDLKPDSDSFCATNAFIRTDIEDWADVTRPMQASQLSTKDASAFLSRNPGQLSVMQRYNFEAQTDSHQVSPKFEDFLGCVSLRGQYTDSRENHPTNLENLYSAHNGASFQDESSKRNFLPFPCNQLGDEPSSFFESSLTNAPHSYHSFCEETRVPKLEDQHVNAVDPEPDLRQLQQHNLLHFLLHQTAEGNLLPQCNPPLPQSSEVVEHGCMPGITNRAKLRQHTVASPERSVHSASSAGKDKLCSLVDPKSLSLSMSPVLESSSGTFQRLQTEGHCTAPVPRKRLLSQSGSREPLPRKSIDTFGHRTSQYRGVTRHRWTGRYEAHLWDNTCRKEGQTRKGRQIYLGGYDKEEKAARAYDLAALKYWGSCTHLNFPLSTYEKELEEMTTMNRQQYIASLRRKSSGFSRGVSIYRGVTRHHQHGRWQARIGRVAGNKDLYLGTFSTQEEAAEAYDIAAIKFRGIGAVTNFDINRYDVKRICTSNSLSIEDLRKPQKEKAVTQPNGEVLAPNNRFDANIILTQEESGNNSIVTTCDAPKSEQAWKGTIYNQAAIQTGTYWGDATDLQTQPKSCNNHFTSMFDPGSQNTSLHPTIPQNSTVLHYLLGNLDVSTTEQSDSSRTIATFLQNVSSPSSVVTNAAYMSNCSGVDSSGNSGNAILERCPKTEVFCRDTIGAQWGDCEGPFGFTSAQSVRADGQLQACEVSETQQRWWERRRGEQCSTPPSSTQNLPFPLFSLWSNP